MEIENLPLQPFFELWIKEFQNFLIFFCKWKKYN